MHSVMLKEILLSERERACMYSIYEDIGNPYANLRKGPQSVVNLYRFDFLLYVSMYIFLLLFLVSGFPVFPQNR
jgi:hypothetical protein